MEQGSIQHFLFCKFVCFLKDIFTAIWSRFFGTLAPFTVVTPAIHSAVHFVGAQNKFLEHIVVCCRITSVSFGTFPCFQCGQDELPARIQKHPANSTLNLGAGQLSLLSPSPVTGKNWRKRVVPSPRRVGQNRLLFSIRSVDDGIVELIVLDAINREEIFGTVGGSFLYKRQMGSVNECHQHLDIVPDGMIAKNGGNCFKDKVLSDVRQLLGIDGRGHKTNCYAWIWSIPIISRCFRNQSFVPSYSGVSIMVIVNGTGIPLWWWIV